MFQQGDFLRTGRETPETLERRRRALQRAMPNFGSARTIGEGVTHLAAGILGGIGEWQANRAEAEGRRGVADFFKRLGERGTARPGGFSILGMNDPVSEDAPDTAPIGAERPAGTGVVPSPVATGGAFDTGGDIGPMGKPFEIATGAIGLNEGEKKAALQDYLSTGGVNLDPATRAWCADFVNATLQQSGAKGTGSSMARSFLNWGEPVEKPQKGDIAVLTRGDPKGPYGHVGFFNGYDENGNIMVLGGNQSDAVNVAAYAPDRLLGFRRAPSQGGGTQVASLDPSIGLPQAGQNPAPVPQAQAQAPRSQPVQLAQADTGVDPSLYEMLANPWLSPEERAVIADMIQEQRDAPMRALEMERARLELERLRNPGREGVVIGGRLVDKATGEVIYQPEPGAGPLGEYGLNPVYGRDKDGNIVVMQLGKDGNAVAARLPEGVRPDLSVQSQERAYGSEVGKQAGEAKASLGNALATGQQALDLINSIYDDPALPSILGNFDGRMPAGIPWLTGGQAGADLDAKIQQLQGKTFLEAYATLKGGGQITEVEGAKAQAAIGRLQRTQSPEAYRAALNDLRDVIASGMERARQKAGMTGASPDPFPTTGGPARGDVPAGIDPADWEAMTPEERALWQ